LYKLPLPEGIPELIVKFTPMWETIVVDSQKFDE
jgi:hypothetical protein